MGNAVQLNSLVPEAADPTSVGTTPTFEVTPTRAGDATHRPQFEGALDAARTFRVRAYIPDGVTDTAFVLTPKDIRTKDGMLDVSRSKDGKVNITAFEDGDVLVLLWTPVAYNTFESLTIKRS